MTSRSAGTSKTSRRHSRVASSSIGNVGCFDAAASRSALALALLPQRRALAGPAPREQQRAGGRLAEDAREQRGARQRLDDRVLDLVGVEEQVVDRDAVHGLGQPEHDAVVGPEHLRAGPEAFLEPGLDRERPRRVHPRAERRQDADAPVAELVAEALDDDRAVVGHGARGLDLLGEVGDEVVGRRARRARPRRAGVRAPRSRRVPRSSRVNAPIARPSSTGARACRLPERQLAGLARGGDDDDAVARDVLDAPARGAQQEHLAAARLVDHLLVELADARAVGRGTRRTARGRGSCRRS